MRAARAGLLAASLLSGGAFAQEEDLTPEFGALAGAELSHFLTRSFDFYRLPIGRFTREMQPVEEIEGRIREFVYRLDGDASTLEAVRNYQRGFAGLGYDTVFECAGDECGGFDFRFGVYLVDPPAMRFDLADFRYLAMADETAGRRASVIASRQGGRLYVQIVAVEGEAALDRLTGGERAGSGREARPGPALRALARRLTERGHAPLDGVDFEPGSARMTETAAEVLDTTATVLKGRPDLRFLVVGHTDDQGELQPNIELSLARAQAVKDRLVAAGVSPDQLEPYGAGFLAPRASNRTPEGRARNRRVELVLR